MYRTIEAGIWDDPKFRSLPPEGKLLFIFLFTNRLSHVSGIYLLPLVVVPALTSLSAKAVRYGIDTLSSLGLARFDEEREVIWVCKMFNHQGKGEKNQRSAAVQLATLHNSFLVKEFLDAYPEVSRYCKPDFLDRVSIGYRRGIQSWQSEQEQEQEKEQKERYVPTASGSPAPRFVSPQDEVKQARKAQEAEREAEIRWRIAQTWETHLRAWRNFFKRENGLVPTNEPALHREDIEKPIRAGLLEHDSHLLAPDQREAWGRESKVRAAGIGIFHDPWCNGSHKDNNVNDGGKRYLEHWRPWKRQHGKSDPIPRFAELYFEKRDAAEATAIAAKSEAVHA